MGENLGNLLRILPTTDGVSILDYTEELMGNKKAQNTEYREPECVYGFP